MERGKREGGNRGREDRGQKEERGGERGREDKEKGKRDLEGVQREKGMKRD